MVPRQGIVLAVFRIVPKVDIKFLSEFWGQTLQVAERVSAVVAHSIMSRL